MAKVIVKSFNSDGTEDTLLPCRVFEDVPGVMALFFAAATPFAKSTGLYATDNGQNGLNCALGSPEPPEVIRHNRAVVAQMADLLSVDHFHTLTQAYNTVTAITEPWDERPHDNAVVAKGIYGIGYGILACDCAPVFFIDPQSETLAVAHIGWR